jgi:small subunit ribosomal protein S24e
MDVEILNERENPLLGRKEVRFRVKYAGAGSPNRQEVRSKMIALLNSNKELTVLDSLKPEYGRNSSKGYIKVYENADAIKIEAEHKKKRNFEVKEKKPSEAGAEAKPAVEPKKGETPQGGEKKEG